MTSRVEIRPVEPADHPALDRIRAAAFAPVFESFRSLLGDSLYELTQARDDQGQGDLLASMLKPGSGWRVFVAEVEGAIVGFASIKPDAETNVGELGLNAVHPKHSGEGVGTAMYEYALERLKELGMRAAVVGTGGDPSHAPARRAYEKAGFEASLPTVWYFKRL